MWYLLSFLIVAIWGILHRTYQVLAQDHHPSYYLSVVESFFSPLQGFLNAVVYGTSPKISNMYVEWFYKGKQKPFNNLVGLDDTNDSSMRISFASDENIMNETTNSFSRYDNKGSPPSLVAGTEHLYGGTIYRKLVDPVATVSTGREKGQYSNTMHNLYNDEDADSNNNGLVEGHSFIYIPRRLSPKKNIIGSTSTK